MIISPSFFPQVKVRKDGPSVRVDIILNTWDEHVHAVPKTLIQDLIGDMRAWVTQRNEVSK